MWGFNQLKINKAICIGLFSLVTATVTQAQTGKNNQKAVIKTAIYCEHCKECETCGQTFKSTLFKMSGVRQFDIDDTAHTITVYYNPKKVSLEEIKVAISKMGYDADEVKADPVVYAQLDNCCKKKESAES